MPSPPMLVAAFAFLLASVPAPPNAAFAQPPAPPAAPLAPAPTPATPAQARAVAEFRPHAERVCRALYVRPDAAETCVQRVLDAALPLAMDTPEPRAPS